MLEDVAGKDLERRGAESGEEQLCLLSSLIYRRDGQKEGLKVWKDPPKPNELIES